MSGGPTLGVSPPFSFGPWTLFVDVRGPPSQSFSPGIVSATVDLLPSSNIVFSAPGGVLHGPYSTVSRTPGTSPSSSPDSLGSARRLAWHGWPDSVDSGRRLTRDAWPDSVVSGRLLARDAWPDTVVSGRLFARDVWPGTWRWRPGPPPVVGLLSPGAVRVH